MMRDIRASFAYNSQIKGTPDFTCNVARHKYALLPRTLMVLWGFQAIQSVISNNPCPGPPSSGFYTLGACHTPGWQMLQTRGLPW